MARLITLFLCLQSFLCLHIKANPDSLLQLQRVQTISGSFTDFTIDNLNNIYLVTSDNQIKKLNSNLDSIGSFNNNKRYGAVYSIDASNPLKVLVYYKDFATIVMLDQQLNIKNSIDLNSKNILQVRAIAQSYDNNCWLFDEVDNKLKKLDDNGNVLLETPDFRLLFDGEFIPRKIIDNNGLIYLYSSKWGWKLFDYYGAYKKSYALLNWKNVQANNGLLLGTTENNLISLDTKGYQQTTQQASISIINALKIIQDRNIYYLLTKQGLEIYKEL